MASEAKRGKERDPQCDSSGLQCICLSQSNTSHLPLISKAAAVAMTDRTSSKISQCGNNGLKCIRLSQSTTSDGPSSSKAVAVNRTHKTISKISQNDFIVNDLFCLDKSATMSTLTVEVIKGTVCNNFTAQWL